MLSLSPVLEPYRDLLEATRQSFVHIRATPADGLPLSASKFGGLPLLPADFPYPACDRGKPMMLLAQLNLSELPPLPDLSLPPTGLLQFYAADNDRYGFDYDHPTRQTGFRVLFFPDVVDEARATQGFETLPAFVTGPIAGEHQLNFAPAAEYVGVADGHFERMLADLERDSGAKLPGNVRSPLRRLLQSQDVDHKIGGYAFFTQDDPRTRLTDYADAQLLLQIDSEGEHITWGDSGVANFFINPTDLAQRDFSRVLYNYDSA